MNLIDSCGWLEYFADGPNADFFAAPLEDIDNVMVASICILEVFKRVIQQRGEDMALQAVSLMKQGHTIDLNTSIALSAAKLGHEFKLPLADSVILATAQLHNATIWTQDADFKSINGVKYVKRK